MSIGPAELQKSPAPSSTSSFVMPPIRKSATSFAPASAAHSRPLRARYWPT